MDGWMDGWLIDGWMVDEWMDGWMMDGWRAGWMDRQRVEGGHMMFCPLGGAVEAVYGPTLGCSPLLFPFFSFPPLLLFSCICIPNGCCYMDEVKERKTFCWKMNHGHWFEALTLTKSVWLAGARCCYCYTVAFAQYSNAVLLTLGFIFLQMGPHFTNSWVRSRRFETEFIHQGEAG